MVPAPQIAVPPPPASPAPARRATAEALGQKQREISVSEFFVKNRHLLGFDNPSKALLTTIKEAVDNSLDTCEEAGIPLLQYAICKLRHKQPALHYMLADALATLDQQIEHHMNMIRSADFMRDRRYLMLVLERTCDLDQVRRRASRSADGSRDTDPTTIDPLEECQPMPA